jgi:ribosomal protein L18
MLLQVIDDTVGHTLAAISTLNPEIRQQLTGSASSNVDAAKLVGAKIAELCKQKNIEKVWGCCRLRGCPSRKLFFAAQCPFVIASF